VGGAGRGYARGKEAASQLLTSKKVSPMTKDSGRHQSSSTTVPNGGMPRG
jgi:hypothetical protein